MANDVLIPAYTGSNAATTSLTPFPKMPKPNLRLDYTGLNKLKPLKDIFSRSPSRMHTRQVMRQPVIPIRSGTPMGVSFALIDRLKTIIRATMEKCGWYSRAYICDQPGGNDGAIFAPHRYQCTHQKQSYGQSSV